MALLAVIANRISDKLNYDIDLHTMSLDVYHYRQSGLMIDSKSNIF
jgi:hypothetical protein